MTPPTLRTTCVRKTCDLLMSGMWEDCVENPFSYLPVSLIQELLSCMWPARSKCSRAIIAHLRLLLTSGRLERFVLSHAGDYEEGDHATLFRRLSRGCKNLRTLSVLDGRYERREERNIKVERALQKLLKKCVKLEQLHSSIYFEPDDLRHCRNLKTLKLHFDSEDAEMFFLSITSDLLKRLHCIEAIAVCRRILGRKRMRFTRTIVSILDNCQQLTSLGFLDLSLALEELHDRDLRRPGTPRRLDLRRCHWGSGYIFTSKFEYFRRIRVAALLCPMVEVLVMQVLYAIGLRHLKALSHLTQLYIHFFECDNFEEEFYSLLGEIGPQLRHLCVHEIFKNKPLSLNVICGKCPNLATLQLYCPITADEGNRSCANLPRLEGLTVYESNQKCLIFLNSNSLHLKMLHLQKCYEFEDALMQAILRKNPFVELEMAIIESCSLSKSGLRRFVLSAVNLSKCHIESRLLKADDAVRCVNDLNPNLVHDIFILDRDAQVPKNINNSCWL